MTKVEVFGSLKIMARNPWYPEMSKKPFYLRDPQDWVGDYTKLSPAQLEAAKAFAKAAKESIVKFPADGKFSTLKERVRWLGSQLVGKGAHGGKYKVPASMTAGHPLAALPESAKKKYEPRNVLGV